MNLRRRQLLLSTLFGAGGLGLRALATGLPAWFLANPRRALGQLATCPGPDKAQYVIFNTSGDGDSINVSAPGTYEDPKIVHSPDPALAPKPLMLSGRPYQAGAPWSTLPQAVLDRMVFWHLMTNTSVHPMEPSVLRLMGATPDNEMFPSLLARQLAPCLGTIQRQPISVGALTPSETLAFAGAPLPVVPALALKATLTNPDGPLTRLQPLRDATLDRLSDLYKNGATKAQRRHIDALVTSQRSVRNIRQDLLGALSSIKDNGIGAQVTAAVALIAMNVSPVVAIHIPFGGDNHEDPGLQLETAQTISGVAVLAALMEQLGRAGLADRVTFLSLNVFGRTMGPGTEKGRAHNGNHQVSLAIGKPFRGGVIGAVAPVDEDYGATAIDSKTGAGVAGGDVGPIDTLAAFAQTTSAALGVDPKLITAPSGTGRVISAALA
jgi:hypothetical protein